MSPCKYMNQHFVVAVEGLIGAGKTTLLHSLPELSGGYVLNFEPVEEFENHPASHFIHPLKSLYDDPIKNASLFQNYVLDIYDQRLSSMFSSILPSNVTIMDRSLDACNVFINTNSGLLSSFGHFYLKDKYIKLRQKYFGNQPVSADAIFYIDIPPSVALERIADRGREGEHNITLEYLKILHQEYDRYLNYAAVHVPVFKASYEDNKVDQFAQFFADLKIPRQKPKVNCTTSVNELRKWI